MLIFAAAILVFLVSCSGGQNLQSGTPVKMEYAQLLHIDQCEGYKLVSVTDPWKDSSLLHQYALVSRDSVVPADIPAGATVVRVPLQRLCVSTSVHAGLMHKLGALPQVSSICEGKYIFNPAVQALLKSGRIKDVGSGLNPNVEMIMQLRTDALLMSPFEGASYGLLEKTGLPIIECADYMETSALGRAEWMRFYGLLVGKGREADSLFAQIKCNYDSLKTLVANVEHHPKLLVDMLNGSTWYVPGGGSTYGSLYKDAGADFSIASPTVSGSQPLSLEKVLTDASDAEIWLIKYSRPQRLDYNSLLAENSVYERFAAFKQRRVYGCNAFSVPFYEEAPFRPDLLLADVISILFPDLLPTHKRIFYSPL